MIKSENIYLKKAIKQMKKMLGKVFFFSIITNMLMLVSPIFMLQLYDRVLTSGSHETLLVLTSIALFLLLIFAAVEYIRQRIMTNVSIAFEQDIREEVFDSLLNSHLSSNSSNGNQSVQDITQLRQFLSSPAIFSFFDAPWIPFFIGIIFYIHPLLGLTGLIGAIVLFNMALISEYMSRHALKESSKYNVESAKYLQSTVRNARVLKAMNMINPQKQRWSKLYNPMLFHAAKGANRLGVISSSSKAFRFVIQVMMLAVGGYLVLQEQITPGTMIASSIILGRGLAPIEQAIGAWKGFVNARAAFQRVRDLMNNYSSEDISNKNLTALPAPQGHWSVEHIVAHYDKEEPPVLKDISIEIEKGVNLGIIGPSGSGKTTLIQLMSSITHPSEGTIRLDGVDVNHWYDLGQYMGYLPQSIELFEGTIAENITRFGEVNSDAMIEAAQTVGAHEVITKLPRHYNTMVREGGSNLSAGQKQLVGLARSFYKQPPIIILDEPSSNLDNASCAALVRAINHRRSIKSASTIMVTHNIPMLAPVDKILVLTDGDIADYGDKDDIIAKFTTRGRVAAQEKAQKQVTQQASQQEMAQSQNAETQNIIAQNTASPNVAPPDISPLEQATKNAQATLSQEPRQTATANTQPQQTINSIEKQAS